MQKDELKFTSGLPSLDRTLQGILAGDNVVWQADNIDDYIAFVLPFCKASVSEGKDLVYLRFAQHKRLLPKDFKATCYEFDPQLGFEQFIFDIFRIIEKHGRGACYVFDCLSDLAVDWYSDRMLGNFFMLTCPYLYDLETVAYFLLLRNHQTPVAIEAIHKTAQVVLDVFRKNDRLYVLPIKVWNRFSPSMYMLHGLEGDTFRPVNKSFIVSEILTKVPQPWLDANIDRQDVWTNTLIQARKIQKRIQHSREMPAEVDSFKKQLIKMIITRDETVSELCKEYFDISDLISISKRMVGTGLIGGKSVGMLLAQSILMKTNRKWEKRLEPHDSFFIGSDLFYTYVIDNDCWWQRRHIQLNPSDHMFEKAEEIQDKLLNGRFPSNIIDQFREILNYFGQSPIIVRSSSLLEDAYGNAFSGKYESIFCANHGTPEQRLKDFIDAVRKVYSSTMSKDALSYRLHRGLLNKDEQMALLVQRVSGECYGDYYFPQIAGVGYSFNPFVWNSKIDPSEGVLRLVFGLGTRAVEQHGNDYTRIVAVNAPLLRPEATFEEVRKHTQKIVDVLDLKENTHTSIHFEDLAKSAASLPMEIFASNDTETEERAKSMNLKNVFTWILTFDNLLSNTKFINDMQKIMKTLENAYKHPVDIEFTGNFIDEDNYRINIVQCRPFQFTREVREIQSPKNVKRENILLKTCGPIIGQSVSRQIDRIIYILPSKYGEMSMQDRYSVARIIGDITNLESKKGEKLKILLIGPGRWGTKMPALGIPVSFAQIKNASVLCEIVAMHEGLTPDISLGTHFFNDLVEMEILYMAVYPKNKDYILNEKLLMGAPNKLASLIPDSKNWTDSIYVADTAEMKDGYTVFMHVNALIQKGIVLISK
ncbi:MAG: hypothetical protein A2X45_24410 [Lentisphaerae bacterium GWF2_50_93]|nr:MAG: hypothetical protein A2X45_24410 [Lentisphaerae bacterium GWF2_50_93]